jgi:hypothetical protein
MANIHTPRQLSATERRKAELRLAVTYLMEEIGGNEHLCNEMVAGGKTAWRVEMTQKFRQLGLMVNDDICDRVFGFFCHMVRKRYHAESSDLTPQKIAGIALDHTEQTSPLTDEQVIDSLEIDSSGTSDDARRLLYGRDNSAEREFEILKDGMKEQLRRGENPFGTPTEDVH